MNRTPVSHTGGIAPLQYRTRAPIDLSHMRVFGSPAQIHVRATIREDKKLSDRSISGTFIGHSTRGNGYIFLVNKNKGTSGKYVEIDSTDVKFNETFSPYRERQGQLASSNEIEPDLTTELEPAAPKSYPIEPYPTKELREKGLNESATDTDIDLNDDLTSQQYGRGKRPAAPRQFLLPGTSSTNQKVLLQPLTNPRAQNFK